MLSIAAREHFANSNIRDAVAASRELQDLGLTSGGLLVNELLDKVALGKYVNIRTGKLDANASSECGKYPFFTCAIKPLRIESFSYDCECVLVAGNGDLNVKYYEGKFDAYQRTYIIESKDKSELNVRYLYYFMSRYVKFLRSQSIGGVIKYIKIGNLTDAKIPLPLLSEQKRIADILDKADAIRRKRQQAIEEAAEATSSMFFEEFGDPLHNPKDWPLAILSDVTTKITDGVHFKPDYTDSGIPFISVKDITTGKLKFDNHKWVSKEAHEKYIKRCKPELHDILYTKVGATYGRPAIVDTKVEFSLYVSVALIKPDHELINPKYLKEVLASHAMKRQADRSIKGAGVPDLHLVEIRKFKLPLPPLNVQENFVRRCEQIHEIEARLALALEDSNDLFNSLVQRAFKGEL